MTRITVQIDGRETVVTDIGPYLKERDDILAALETIYAGFEKGPVDALASSEAEIVDLVNRFHVADHVIAMFESADAQRANILAGWAVVKQNRAGDST